MRNIIVFSGYNQRAVISFLRTLTECNLQFNIIASGDDDSIFLTDYANKVSYVRSKKDLNLTDLKIGIDSVKNKNNINDCIIMPSTEALNRFLLNNISFFNSIDCCVPLVDYNKYKLISDKKKFGDFCSNFGAKVPMEYDNIINLNRYPFVAKPKEYLCSSGIACSPCIINDNLEKNKFINNNLVEDFYYQEYIDGSCHYLLYYVYKNGEKIKLSQKNLIQQPYGKSMIGAVIDNSHEDKSNNIYDDIIDKIEYNGLLMIELKKRKGDYFMIEANPRFWGPSQLFVDYGVNLFKDLLYENGLINNKPIHKISNMNRYFWYGGVGDDINKLSYHDYSKSEFESDFKLWKISDIYNRFDTLNLYSKGL